MRVGATPERSETNLDRWPKLVSLHRLESLAGSSFETMPFSVLSESDWAKDYEGQMRLLLRLDLGPVVIVRSCAALEDAADHEPAGYFESVLDVPFEPKALSGAIEQVISSYRRRQQRTLTGDKVIVQRQLLGPRLCGVCRVAADDGYIEVDYDETTGRTDSVTSGLSARRVALSPRTAFLSSPWRQIRLFADELRKHFSPPFFVEFALGTTGRPVVFQVRADRRAQSGRPRSPLRICERIEAAAAIVEKTGPLSVMADWNPVEMLGVRPMPLDMSLYEHLIMRGTWAAGRKSLGWNSPSDLSLMAVIGGRPYVKLRPSLQSLLPTLRSQLANRIVDDRLDRLASSRHLHDKVEFRLMWSAFALDEKATSAELLDRGFLASEIGELFAALKAVTRRTIDGAGSMLAEDRHRALKLSSERVRLTQPGALRSPVETARRVRTALDACRDFGTEPFSRQARIAFTFRFIINHLREAGGLEAPALERWQASLNTVTRKMSRDLSRVNGGVLRAEQFLRRYGHLRPSTYDLESRRYDEREIPITGPAAVDLPLSSVIPRSNDRLGQILREIGAEGDQRKFWRAAAAAFKGREDLKFRFTALLSDILKVLADAGEHVGIARRRLRQLPIDQLLTIMESSAHWADFAKRVPASAALQEMESERLRLPDVIIEPGDLDVVAAQAVIPTFIGTRPATAAPCQIHMDSDGRAYDVAGAMVVVETADPGYDWVFAQAPAGLITAYGGEFSHMGLRCAEFGIPAAIGCGTAVVALAGGATQIALDPIARRLWADGDDLLTP